MQYFFLICSFDQRWNIVGMLLRWYAFKSLVTDEKYVFIGLMFLIIVSTVSLELYTS